jgi:hypothetical protein
MEGTICQRKEAVTKEQQKDQTNSQPDIFVLSTLWRPQALQEKQSTHTSYKLGPLSPFLPRGGGERPGELCAYPDWPNSCW